MIEATSTPNTKVYVCFFPTDVSFYHDNTDSLGWCIRHVQKIRNNFNFSIKQKERRIHIRSYHLWITWISLEGYSRNEQKKDRGQSFEGELCCPQLHIEEEETITEKGRKESFRSFKAKQRSWTRGLKKLLENWEQKPRSESLRAR